MKNLEFHHIGYACEVLDEQLKFFLALGYSHESEIFEDRTQRIRGCFLTLGSHRVELLEPLASDSPVWPFLKKGIHMYHLAYLSNRFLHEIEELKTEGAIEVAKPQPAVAFGGRRICFLMLRNRLLVEIIEAESPS